MSQATARAAYEPIPADPGRSLRADSVAFFGSVANSVGIQAPTGGVSFLPALMAGFVGASGPLAFLLALVAMCFVAYAFVVFTRQLSSAGSIYAFNGTALGPSYGFVSVWLLLGVYVVFAGSVFASVANGAQVLLASAGISVPWVWLALGFWALTFVLTYRSIALSSRVILVLEAASLALVAVVAVATVAHGGWGGHRLSPAPFAPPASGLGTLGLGIVFAFTGFSGFEVAATLGEESSRAKRVIPAAVVVALLVSGGVYTAMSWVETIGFPSATALAHSPLPLVGIARAFVGPPMGTIVNVAALVSGFGACLAATNGAVRLVFALARDGLGPSPLARTHPVHRSPVAALALVSVLTLGSFLPLIGGKPLTAFTVLATYGADLIVVAYLLTCAAAVAFSLRRGGLGRRRRAAGVAIPLAGVGVLAWVLESSIWPLPAPPFDLLVYLTGAALATAIAMVALRPGLRRRLGASPLFRVEAG